MYQLYSDTTAVVRRLSDGATVPVDPTNRDGAAYLEWLGDGNTPEPAYVDPPPSAVEQLATSDHKMARIGEDLIDVLVGKGVITLADLPDAARQKLVRRRTLRDTMAD